MNSHICSRCGSEITRSIPGPHPGGHFARLECAGCGRFLKWLPRPQEPGGAVPAAILAVVHPRKRPALLVGTEGQIRFARSLRERALFNFGRMNRPDLVALIKCVVDATWFLANKGKPLRLIRWPSEWQMESAVVSGRCPRCGDLLYGQPFCSEECLDESSAALTVDPEAAAPAAGG